MKVKLWRLVQPQARRRFLTLSLLVGLGGLVELAGIAIVAEMMRLVASGGLAPSRGLFAFGFQALNANTTAQRLSLGLAASIAVLAFVHAYSALCAFLRYQFVWMQDKEISTRLFSSTLQRPYAWFLQKNSADLSYLLMSGQFTQRLLGNILSAISHLAVATTLGVALFLADPSVAFVGALVVATAYSAVRLGTRSLLEVKGGLAHEAERERNKAVKEALNSIRFLKTTGKEPFFVKRFAELSETASKGMVYHGIYVHFVRAFLEWVAFAGVLGLSVYLLLHTSNFAELLPRLTLYTMAAYRMIPAIHELFGLWARLRFDGSYLEGVDELLESPKLEQAVEQSKLRKLEVSEPLITLEDVEFRYPSSERDILYRVNLCVSQREWIGLVGTTGAGKTTLLDILSGLCQPTRGIIKIGSDILGPHYVADWQSRIGVVPQEVILIDDTLERNVAFGLADSDIDPAKIQRVCAAAGLFELLKTLPDGYQTRLGERGVRLSGGERQRVGLARALYLQPDLLLLDEATSALDQATEARIVSTLRGLVSTCTLVMVAHRLSSLKPCDRILVLEAGRIVSEGTYDQLLQQSATFRELALVGG